MGRLLRFPITAEENALTIDQKGVANGVATLDENAFIDVDQLPMDYIEGLVDKETLVNKILVNYKEVSIVLTGTTIDLSQGSVFEKTIAANTSLTVTNVPATGYASGFMLELYNAGSYTINWWAGIKWANGISPTLTATGKDALFFYTKDGGNNWVGLVTGKDIK